MTRAILLVLFYVLRVSTSDWVSEWMTPVQGQFYGEKSDQRRSSDVGNLKKYEDEYQKVQKMIPILESNEFPLDLQKGMQRDSITSPVGGLKLKIETTLENAKTLAEVLRNQIIEMTFKEKLLKETITNGRNGMTLVTVSTMGQLPRKYTIRDGVWTLCTGIMQPQVVSMAARCFGKEVAAMPDPCAFNSIIKYETIPTRRKLQYTEDDYLCLKPNFNVTLEQYMSVPKRFMNETCRNGSIRSLEDNIMECGLRVLSEYSYYPNKGVDQGYTNPDLPLEYCVEADGSCKLLVAWHISNSTIENFEFLKDEPGFKKLFIKSGSLSELFI